MITLHISFLTADTEPAVIGKADFDSLGDDFLHGNGSFFGGGVKVVTGDGDDLVVFGHVAGIDVLCHGAYDFIVIHIHILYYKYSAFT